MEKISSGKNALKVQKWILPSMNNFNQLNAAYNPESTSLSELLDEAYKLGFTEGKIDQVNEIRTELTKEMQEKLTEQAKKVDSCLQNLLSPWHMIDKEVEKQVFSFICTIVKKITQREMSTHPDIVLSLIQGTLELLPESCQTLKLFVSASDYEFVNQYLNNRGGQQKTIQLFQDEALQAGEYRIDSQDSSVEALIEKRIDLIMDESLNHAE